MREALKEMDKVVYFTAMGLIALIVLTLAFWP